MYEPQNMARTDLTGRDQTLEHTPITAEHHKELHNHRSPHKKPFDALCNHRMLQKILFNTLGWKHGKIASSFSSLFIGRDESISRFS